MDGRLEYTTIDAGIAKMRLIERALDSVIDCRTRSPNLVQERLLYVIKPLAYPVS